mmetsp:Transcript_83471/g.244717  ORF Transcript_83471/g.244717 Transcript_83471/m.244717 type:complete len:214 (+) Transcript_83471:358-999(+)
MPQARSSRSASLFSRKVAPAREPSVWFHPSSIMRPVTATPCWQRSMRVPSSAASLPPAREMPMRQLCTKLCRMRTTLPAWAATSTPTSAPSMVQRSTVQAPASTRAGTPATCTLRRRRKTASCALPAATMMLSSPKMRAEPSAGPSMQMLWSMMSGAASVSACPARTWMKVPSGASATASPRLGQDSEGTTRGRAEGSRGASPTSEPGGGMLA